MNEVTVKFDIPLNADAKSFLSALLGSAIPVGGGATGTPEPTPINQFPSDPGLAPFPSPENSTSTVINGKISGAPYLRSAQGAIWQFDFPQDGLPIRLTSEYSTGYQVSVNGTPITNAPCQMLLVRQGQVYVQVDNIWSTMEQTDSPISGIAHTTPPPPWTTTGTDAVGGTVALPAMPAAPTPFTAWTGNVILFGDNQTYKTMQEAHDAAQPGDTIQAGPEMVGKTVTMTLRTSKPIVVDLLGRISQGAGTETPTWNLGMLLDMSKVDSGTFPMGKGCIVPMADCIVRGADITGAGIMEAAHGGTAAIRAGADINLTVDHCHLWKNQNGVGPMLDGTGGTTTITNSWLFDNYLPNEDAPGAHNVYAEGVSLTFGPGVTSICNPSPNGTLKGTHAIKGRCAVTNGVAPFFLYSGDSSSLDIPSGSTAVCNIGAGTIAKKAGDLNHTVAGYAVENILLGLAGMKFAGTSFPLFCDNPLIGAAGPINFDSACKFTGNKPTGPGLVTGLPG